MNSASFDESRWVIQIRRHIDEETDEDDANIRVSIFNVPKILTATDPDSYVPQQLALGPYHHWRSELYDMERYKLSAARRTQCRLNQGLSFQHLVDDIAKLETRIRASYHKYLNVSGETLAWMMAVDVCFLLEFLYIYGVNKGRAIKRVSSKMSHLVDAEGRKSAHNAILRDVVMLENQIPLFLLKKVLVFQYNSAEPAEKMLHSMLFGFYKEISPFKSMEELPKNVQADDCAHLLEFIYHMMVPKAEELQLEIFAVAEDEITEANEGGGEDESSFAKPGYVKQAFDVIWIQVSKLNVLPVSYLKKLIFARPVTLVMKLPWQVISNIPGLKVLKQLPVTALLFSGNKKDVKEENNKSNIPLIEEIAIPSVTELAKAGVRFLPAKGGVFDISFDKKTFILYLPIVSLDVSTEVLMRNLVAYETCNGSGPLVLTRYTELMNGIIDTEEDAKYLRENGIVFNHLKSDKEVADLWNGMSKSIKLSKVPFLDKVIEDVNKHYHGRWKVKIRKFMTVYVYNSWRVLTLLATIFLLFMTFVQAFCSVYSCARVLHIPKEFQPEFQT